MKNRLANPSNRADTYPIMRKPLWFLACLAFVPCLAAQSTYTPPTPEQLHANIPTNPVKHCTSKNGLPDSKCTPGATRPATLDEICKGPSTSTVRPDDDYTDSLKKAQIIEYGWADTNPADYEEDHLISLEIGGNPTDPKNLWPEPYNGPFNSHMKDKVEDWLHDQVCSGKMTLEQAQKGISTNWKQYIKAANAESAAKPAAKTD
jgi:hypothetical protein